MKMRAALGTMAMATALVVTAAPTQAQQPQREGARREQPQRMQDRTQDPSARIEMRVQRLTEQLALSSDQAAQVKTVLERQHAQMSALMEQNGFTAGERQPRAQRTRPDSAQRAALRAQMDALQAQTDAGIEAILSAEQKQKYETLQGPMRERRGERPQRPRGGRTS